MIMIAQEDGGAVKTKTWKWLQNLVSFLVRLPFTIIVSEKVVWLEDIKKDIPICIKSYEIDSLIFMIHCSKK